MLPEACKFIKKETRAQEFSCEFCEISKNTLFSEHLWTTASLTRSMRTFVLNGLGILKIPQRLVSRYMLIGHDVNLIPISLLSDMLKNKCNFSVKTVQ